MKKNLTLKYAVIASSAMLTMLPPVADAQRAGIQRLNVGKPVSSISPKLQRVMPAGQNGAPSLLRRPSAKLCSDFPKKSVAKGCELWVNLVYKNTWTEQNMERGMFVLNTSDPEKLEPLTYNDDLVISSGSGVQDGEFYGLYADLSLKDYGVIASQLFNFSADTWRLNNVGKLAANEVTLIGYMETAQNLDNGNIYGEFYDKKLQSLEWGVIDYVTKSRTTIAPAQNHYVALGCAKSGDLYGITGKGDLFHIDPYDFSENYVGSTGLSVDDDNNRHYGQTGAIDPATNTFYWIATDLQGNSSLFTVNLQTAELTRIADLGNAQYAALTVPPTYDNYDAPAKATDLNVRFDGPSTTGTISFMAPTTTVSGDKLSGTLTYIITANNEQLAEGDVQPGEAVTADISAPSGRSIFAVSTQYDYNESPKAHVSQWVGYDIPEAPERVNLTYDFDTHNSELTWTATTKGCHDRYIGDITYDVYRYIDGNSTKVKTNTTDTHFSETLNLDGIHQCQYAVVAKNEKYSSVNTLSLPIVVGNPLTVPYTDDFTSNENNIGLYSLIDNNCDGVTWGYTSSGNGNYVYMPKSSAIDDDWFITPPFALESGYSYTVTVDAEATGDNANKLEMKATKSVTADEYNIPVIGAKSFTGRTTLTGTLDADASGRYYLCLHNISDAKSGMVKVYSISISRDALADAPQAVTGLKAEPDAEGLAKCAVSFITPSKTIGGNALSSLTKVVLQRNGKDVNTWNNPETGTALSFSDEDNIENGYNTYSVIAYNDKGYGEKAEQTVYVGVDTAKAVTGLAAEDLSTKVRLTWNATDKVGINGRVVRPQDAKYIIYNVDANNQLSNVIATTSYTSYEFDFDTNKGDQRFAQWAVAVNTAAGNSKTQSTSLPVGSPYTLPFAESFKDGSFSNFWSKTFTSYSIQPKFYTDMSADGDGACYGFYNYTNGEGTLQSGKISLQGSTNPVLLYYFYPVQGKDVKLQVEAVTEDGKVTVLRTWNYKELPGTPGWASDKISLAKFVGNRFVRLQFHVIYNDKMVKTCVDNIRVIDLQDDNLSISLSTPAKTVRGKDVNAEVTVENIGANAANGYKVKMYSDGNFVGEQTAAESLPSLSKATFNFAIPSYSGVKDYTKLNVKAEIEYDDDLDDLDNVAESNVEVITADVAPVKDLKAEKTSSATDLTWIAPEACSKNVVEDFEGYDAFTTVFGDWSSMWGKGYTGAMFSNSSYNEPYAHKQIGFFIYNPDAVNPNTLYNNPGQTPHSGKQYCSALYRLKNLNGDYSHVDNDDWLISPRLSGKEQTVTFWVKNEVDGYGIDNPETFEILASKSGVEKTDFVKIVDTQTLTGGEWQKIEVSIPEGNYYFAIHHNTSEADAFLFSIDDVEYEAGYPALASFNVYRDGKFIANVSDGKSAYADNSTKDAVYAVTAVYPDGTESEPVEVTTGTTGISNLYVGNDGDNAVYTLDGKLVSRRCSNIATLPKGIYIVNNRKVVVK